MEHPLSNADHFPVTNSVRKGVNRMLATESTSYL